ncbi:APC5 protein [Paraconiothyrium brasiliense]|uniref:APC5 protein n=1 Tax=Paraconiothyrium brasiliense TaxID=300254 RepID=A0ABR3S9S4_9PLEO
MCYSKDWTACEALFSSLQPDSSTDPELTFLLSESRIDYLVARGLYSQAWDAVEKLSITLKEEGADFMQRISLLIAKADICRRLGRPERGFSVALRAASVAFKAHMKTCVVTAVGLIANILNSNGDYNAATRLLGAIIPQSLENGDIHVTGTLYSHMGDAHMGLAGLEDVQSPASFKKAEDVEGECDQLMKKAIIARLRGDEGLAEEWAHDHNRVWEHGMERIASNSVEVH